MTLEKKQPRILVVDDEISIRVTLKAFLEDEGFQVEVAEDADKVMDLLSIQDFDVVVTDVVMPRITGVDLLKLIKETKPYVQVILMTGEPNVETASSAVRIGAFDYLTKPIDKPQLIKTVSKAITLKLIEDERRNLKEENKKYQEDLEILVNERTAKLQESEGNYKRIYNEQKTLYESAISLSSSLDLNTILAKLVKQICDLLDATSAYISTLDSNLESSSVVAEYFGKDASDKERISDLGLTYDIAHLNVISKMLKTGKSVVYHVDDPDIDEYYREYLLENGGVSVLETPLKSGGEFTAYLEVWDTRHKRNFTPNEILLCEAIASQAAIAIDNAYLYKKSRESELRFRSFFENGPLGIFVAKQNSIVVEVNHQACELLGYSQDEIVGKRMSEFIHQEDHEMVAGKIIEAMETNQPDYSMKVRFVKKSGDVIWTNQTSTFIFDEKGIPSLGVAIIEDITERKISEEQLLYQAMLLENISDAVVSSDNEFGILSWNQAAEELYDWTAEEAKGKDVRELLDFEYLNSDRESVFDQLEKTGVWSGETRQKTKNGVKIYVQATVSQIYDDQGESIGLVAINRDITEQKRTEEALREHQETIQSIVETSQDWIWALDTEFVHTYSNPAVEQILGYHPEDMIGKGSIRLMHPEDAEKLREPLAKWIAEKKGWSDLIVRWRHKDGSYRYLESNAVPILDAGGELIGFRGVDRDITERKQAEETHNRSREQLQILHEIDTAILAAQSPKEVAESVVGRLRVNVKCERVEVFLANEVEQIAEILAVDAAPGFELKEIKHISYSDYEDVIKVLEKNKDYLITNSNKRDVLAKNLRTLGVQISVAIPMFVNELFLGAIHLGYTNPDLYTPEIKMLMRQIADQLAIAIHQAQLVEQIKNDQDNLQMLTKALFSAQEDERLHISRELHDEVGQSLTALIIDLEMIKADLPPDGSNVLSRLSETVDLANKTLENLRSLAQGLRPPALDSVGLKLTLEDMCSDIEHRTGMEIEYESGDMPELSNIVSITMYRFLQEALTNAIKHSQAKQVKVKLSCDDVRILLSVEDDGIGFDPKQIQIDQAIGKGIGIINMKERFELVGGTLDIESSPGKGTCLVGAIPIEVN